MADPLSLCASILAVAGAGVKLASALYTVSETIYRADTSLKNVAQDISLTSAVLNELGELLQHESRGKSKICSDNAVKTADEAIQGCKNIFDEFEESLKGSVKRGQTAGNAVGKIALTGLGKLKWPITNKKMELLRSNLERLKSTLNLLLNVLNYAKQLSSDNKPDKYEMELQRAQIAQLVKLNQSSQQRFLEMEKSFESLEIQHAPLMLSRSRNLTSNMKGIIAESESYFRDQVGTKFPKEVDPEKAPKSVDITPKAYPAPRAHFVMANSAAQNKVTEQSCQLEDRRALLRTAEEVRNWLVGSDQKNDNANIKLPPADVLSKCCDDIVTVLHYVKKTINKLQMFQVPTGPEEEHCNAYNNMRSVLDAILAAKAAATALDDSRATGKYYRGRSSGLLDGDSNLSTSKFRDLGFSQYSLDARSSKRPQTGFQIPFALNAKRGSLQLEQGEYAVQPRKRTYTSIARCENSRLLNDHQMFERDFLLKEEKHPDPASRDIFNAARESTTEYRSQTTNGQPALDSPTRRRSFSGFYIKATMPRTDSRRASSVPASHKTVFAGSIARRLSNGSNAHRPSSGRRSGRPQRQIVFMPTFSNPVKDSKRSETRKLVAKYAMRNRPKIFKSSAGVSPSLDTSVASAVCDIPPPQPREPPGSEYNNYARSSGAPSAYDLDDYYNYSGSACCMRISASFIPVGASFGPGVGIPPIYSGGYMDPLQSPGRNEFGQFFSGLGREEDGNAMEVDVVTELLTSWTSLDIAKLERAEE